MAKNKYKTAEQTRRAKEKQKQRCKILNTVKRHNIDTSCLICGQPGVVIQNYVNPYKISFLCKQCKKNPINLEKAKENRIDIQEIILQQARNNMRNQRIKTLSKESIKEIIDNYLIYIRYKRRIL